MSDDIAKSRVTETPIYPLSWPAVHVKFLVENKCNNLLKEINYKGTSRHNLVKTRRFGDLWNLNTWWRTVVSAEMNISCSCATKLVSYLVSLMRKTLPCSVNRQSYFLSPFLVPDDRDWFQFPKCRVLITLRRWIISTTFAKLTIKADYFFRFYFFNDPTLFVVN
jgi:hypothetical protein